MGDLCHVVLGQKLRNFKGPVGRGTVMVDNEVLVLPFLWPLAPHILCAAQEAIEMAKPS